MDHNSRRGPQQSRAVVFLQGGPGDVTNPWSFLFFAPWEKHFTVVQWDQRGAGRTLRKTGPSVTSTMTVDRMTKDGIEVAEYLRKHLGKDKIIVLGHSFGYPRLLNLQWSDSQHSRFADESRGNAGFGL
jgi:pimeloyl-ACP methyl ester carboxylesterase